jgi:endonuclease/exonuclease/phosphatase (EEP) superfamily protein YafD
VFVRPSLRKRFPEVLFRVATIVVLCLVGLLSPFISNALSGFGGVVLWAIDLAAHWQWVFLGGLVIGVVVAACFQPMWILALLAAPLPWISASSKIADTDANGRTLTVASANVNVDNSNPAPLLDWLKAIDADVVVILEVSPEFAKALKASPDYPYRQVIDRNDPFGIALISRLPLIGPEIFESKDGIPRIESGFDWNGEKANIVAFHPMPPLSPYFRESRDGDIRSITTRLEHVPSIVAGDFNATPWSSAFHGIESSGFRRTGGLSPTFPAAGGGWFGIPIDHVLASRRWKSGGSSVGPRIGSDHLPVATRLILETPRSQPVF